MLFENLDFPIDRSSFIVCCRSQTPFCIMITIISNYEYLINRLVVFFYTIEVIYSVKDTTNPSVDGRNKFSIIYTDYTLSVNKTFLYFDPVKWQYKFIIDLSEYQSRLIYN